ncbi:peptidogalycan biosysnthesis protein [Kitasatospora sp. HPMI-4]|uniref:peptidogalycan biosysnthesis protein n=1 Tax=Kitasatospora sp. HPMI-4 TaxID=3448443 RepID=UPI003F1B5053
MDDVDADAWDRIAGDAGFYLSHRWLRHEEDSTTATARYVLVTDTNARLVAATPVYLVESELNPGYRPHEQLTGVAEAKPLVVAGARRGYHNSPLLDSELAPEDRADCLRLLVQTVEELVHAYEAEQAWWLYVRDEVAAELKAATGAEVAHLQKLDAAIALPGADFDSYLRSLPSKRRVVISRERRRFCEAGYEVRRLKLSECWQETGGLLAELQGKYGHSAAPEPMRRLLRAQAEGLGDTGTVIGCFLGEHMVGFSLCYEFAGTCWIRATGFDYDRLHGAAEYFSLVFYEPIQDAYRSQGLRRLHLGTSSSRAKALRGAQLSPLWAIPNNRGYGGAPAPVVSANRRLAGTWEAELGHYAPVITI